MIADLDEWLSTTEPGLSVGVLYPLNVQAFRGFLGFSECIQQSVCCRVFENAVDSGGNRLQLAQPRSRIVQDDGDVFHDVQCTL